MNEKNEIPLSVIMPVYNVEKYLPTMVDSVLAQTYRDFELIMVDDGSPDNSPALCDDYAARDPRVRVIHKENGGVSTARNAGIEAARGEYIYFADSDDYLYPETLETIMREIGDRDFLVMESMKGMRAEFDELSKERVTTVHARQTAEDLDGLRHLFLGMLDHVSYLWKSLMRRDIIIDNNLRFDQNLRLAEDLAFLQTYIRYIRSAARIDYQGVYYMQNEGSAVHDYRRIPEDAFYDMSQQFQDANAEHFQLTEEQKMQWQDSFAQERYRLQILYLLKGYQPECHVPRKERLRRWKRMRNDKLFQRAHKLSFWKPRSYHLVEYCCTTGLYPLVDPLLSFLGSRNKLRFNSLNPQKQDNK